MSGLEDSKLGNISYIYVQRLKITMNCMDHHHGVID